MVTDITNGRLIRVTWFFIETVALCFACACLNLYLADQPSADDALRGVGSGWAGWVVRIISSIVFARINNMLRLDHD